jgi:single-strand DNA-binding protein
MSCLVDGRLSIRSYETKEGEKRKAAEVVVNTMQMLDRANRSGDGGGSYERPRAAAPAASGGGFDDEHLEDEIPF